MNLILLGWSDFFAQAFAPHADLGLSAARITVQHRGAYQVVSECGEFVAEISGRLRHEAAAPSAFPATGDWVALAAQPDDRKAVIHAVMPRRTKFSRAACGDRTEEQVLAANIDDAFIVEALADEVNLRRIERYLTLAWESGAKPSVVLAKADLCHDLTGAVASVQSVARGVPVLAISSVTGEGMDAL